MGNRTHKEKDAGIHAQSARVVLIRPPRLLSRSGLNANSPVPPLGIAYLAAALKAAGFPVTCIDACGEAPDQILPFDDLPFLVNGLDADQIAAAIPEDCALVGVSCMFSREWAYHKRVIRAVRTRLPHVPIVAGGEHITADPELSLQLCPELDLCAAGEGDETIVELARAIVEQRPFHDVAGLVFRKSDGTPERTPARKRIQALDELPWPDWDLLPLRTYLDRGFGMNEIGIRSMPMLASRGCPYRCTFCSSPQMWGTRWVARDVADVVREIRHAVEHFRVEHVEFHDLTAIIDRRWILAFSEALIEARLGITWTMPSGTRSEALDAEVLEKLARSGCRGITYAPESGSPETLARIHKKVKPERMLTSIRSAVKLGLYTKAHIIIGLPGQDWSELAESFRFMLKLMVAGVNDVLVYPFNAYPGSALHAQLVAEGRIDPFSPDYEKSLLGADYGDVRSVVSWSEYFSAAVIRRLAAVSMLIFYVGQFLLRPWRGFTVLWRLARSTPQTWMERVLSSLWRRFVAGRFVPRSSTARILRNVARVAVALLLEEMNLKVTGWFTTSEI